MMNENLLIKTEQMLPADKILEIMRSMPSDAQKSAYDYMNGFRDGMDFQSSRAAQTRPTA